MPKNTLHIGSHSKRVKHTFVQECKCAYYHVMKKVMKCAKCRSEEEE